MDKGDGKPPEDATVRKYVATLRHILEDDLGGDKGDPLDRDKRTAVRFAVHFIERVLLRKEEEHG